MTIEDDAAAQLRRLADDVSRCRACPRLVAWRERVAAERTARFADQVYWGRPVPGFGDTDARILVVGLAPAAHGANRTGRMFTGDRAGDFLFAAMHQVGLANQPTSVSADDGLRLRDTWLTAVNRCAPPDNKPTPVERDNCRPFLEREMDILERARVIVSLGGWSWDGVLRTLAARGIRVSPKPVFGHGVEVELGPWTLLGCYHPSQQNTFTGRLTPPMLESVLRRARVLAGLDEPGPR